MYKILALLLILLIPTYANAWHRYRHHHVKKETIPLPKERIKTFDDVWNDRVK